MVSITRRSLFAALVLICLPGLAIAQAWPQKPVRWIISFAPGGVHDTLARLLQPRLTEALGSRS